jgi:hypothetical protein
MASFPGLPGGGSPSSSSSSPFSSIGSAQEEASASVSAPSNNDGGGGPDLLPLARTNRRALAQYQSGDCDGARHTITAALERLNESIHAAIDSYGAKANANANNNANNNTMGGNAPTAEATATTTITTTPTPTAPAAGTTGGMLTFQDVYIRLQRESRAHRPPGFHSDAAGSRARNAFCRNEEDEQKEEEDWEGTVRTVSEPLKAPTLPCSLPRHQQQHQHQQQHHHLQEILHYENAFHLAGDVPFDTSAASCVLLYNLALMNHQIAIARNESASYRRAVDLYKLVNDLVFGSLGGDGNAASDSDDDGTGPGSATLLLIASAALHNLVHCYATAFVDLERAAAAQDELSDLLDWLAEARRPDRTMDDEFEFFEMSLSVFDLREPVVRAAPAA